MGPQMGAATTVHPHEPTIAKAVGPAGVTRVNWAEGDDYSPCSREALVTSKNNF